jgi:hypothetical protein
LAALASVYHRYPSLWNIEPLLHYVLYRDLSFWIPAPITIALFEIIDATDGQPDSNTRPYW